MWEYKKEDKKKVCIIFLLCHKHPPVTTASQTSLFYLLSACQHSTNFDSALANSASDVPQYDVLMDFNGSSQ